MNAADFADLGAGQPPEVYFAFVDGRNLHVIATRITSRPDGRDRQLVQIRPSINGRNSMRLDELGVSYRAALKDLIRRLREEADQKHDLADEIEHTIGE